jgi:hypothetical protein
MPDSGSGFASRGLRAGDWVGQRMYVPKAEMVHSGPFITEAVPVLA